MVGWKAAIAGKPAPTFDFWQCRKSGRSRAKDRSLRQRLQWVGVHKRSSPLNRPSV